MDGKIVYRSERIINKIVLEHNNMPKDYLERIAIEAFMKDIPIHKLKELVNFEEVNPDVKAHWENSKDRSEIEKLYCKREIKFKMRIAL